MNYKELLEKYNQVLNENNRLIAEINRLKFQLGITKPEPSGNQNLKKKAEEATPVEDSTAGITFSNVSNASDSNSKINLFMSLFKGRHDVYAIRWENKKKGTSGYSPVFVNQWQAGLCGKPKIQCSKCPNKNYAALNEETIENHLRGNIIAGIYPMLPDETCCFLAIDFDEADWQTDVSMIRDVCNEFNIPVAAERSRSGNGGHMWFFFEIPISIVYKLNIHQKFAIIDQKIVWYGSINFLSYGNAQESIMRIESPNIANELIKSIEN
jgi:hypothetical protein